MQIEEQEREQLEKGWTIILILWGSMFLFLGVYIGFCYFFGSTVKMNTADNFPADIFKYSMFGISFITLISVYYLRKLLLGVGKSTFHTSSSSGQHPAVAKYTVTIIITSALLEGIAIFGVVLFLLVNDSAAFYQLIGMSAASMIYFRPQKEELFDLARQIRKR
jgi:hypothetical protein